MSDHIMATAAGYENGTALESRADVESLDELHAERRALLPEYAALRVLHGQFGKWDNRRKQMLEAIKVRVRMEREAKGEKCTDAIVDAYAHADEQYAAVIDEGITGAARYVELDIRMSEIEERIRNREVSLLAYNAEARLGR